MKSVELIVDNLYVRDLFTNRGGYEEFIKKQPPFEKRVRRDDLSSMFEYFVDHPYEKQRKIVLKRLVAEAGLDGNLKKIFFCFKNSESDNYTIGQFFDYHHIGSRIGFSANKKQVKKEILDYLIENKDKPALLVFDEHVERVFNTLNIPIAYLASHKVQEFIIGSHLTGKDAKADGHLLYAKMEGLR